MKELIRNGLSEKLEYKMLKVAGIKVSHEKKKKTT